MQGSSGGQVSRMDGRSPVMPIVLCRRWAPSLQIGINRHLSPLPSALPMIAPTLGVAQTYCLRAGDSGTALDEEPHCRNDTGRNQSASPRYRCRYLTESFRKQRLACAP